MNVSQVYGYLREHPLTRDHRFEAYKRYIRWQIASRVLNEAVAVPYVNNSRIFVRRGLHASTSTYYTGLKEFADMGFAMHLLRSEDIFIDIGANIGVFTVLASAGAGATVYAFEPFPSTYMHLMDNINLNHGHIHVFPFQICIGDSDGDIEFEIDRRSSSRNHVRPENSDDRYTAGVIRVPIRTLDSIIDRPAICLKIDVEGYESSVIAGAQSTLDSSSLCAVIIEMNPAALKNYGHDPSELHLHMLSKGFSTYRYDAMTRKLNEVSGFNLSGNTLYLRNIDFIHNRIANAPPFRILGHTI